MLLAYLNERISTIRGMVFDNYAPYVQSNEHLFDFEAEHVRLWINFPFYLVDFTCSQEAFGSLTNCEASISHVKYFLR